VDRRAGPVSLVAVTLDGPQKRGGNRTVRLVLGAVVVVIGVVWTLQGLGYLPGSEMSGVTLWAVLGPLVALAGIAVALSGRRRRG